MSPNEFKAEPKREGVRLKLWNTLSGMSKALSILVFMFALYALYGAYAEKAARQDAAMFCSGIKLGDESADLLSRAISSSANSTSTKWFKRPGQSDWLPVTYVGLPPFSRYICSIESVGGKVSKMELKHID